MGTKIIASSKEEFDKLQKDLDSLEPLIKSNVELVEQAFNSPKFTFYQKYDAKVKIYVPMDISYVSQNGNEIQVLSQKHGWFYYPYKCNNYELIGK